MPDQPGKCPACGNQIGQEVDLAALPNPHREGPKNWAEENLQRHVQLLEQISGQLERLQATLEAGTSAGPELAAELETFRASLKPRHGLCIDAHCAPCRVHEEAIKEHVLLYVDWKVPGTVEKLEQARHRN